MNGCNNKEHDQNSNLPELFASFHILLNKIDNINQWIIANPSSDLWNNCEWRKGFKNTRKCNFTCFFATHNTVLEIRMGLSHLIN